MTEWKLFDGDAPDFSTLLFFQEHPWVPPAHQEGHAQRTAMTADMIRKVSAQYELRTLSDLGCGDGALLDLIRDLPVQMWGYDAGEQNVAVARAKGLDVRQADILASSLEYGDLITCCEVLEHLADPHGFLNRMPGNRLVITSPSAETADWHYVHHAWAWDLDGYAALASGAGWHVKMQVECDGGVNHHGGTDLPQRFQAIFAVK